MTRGENENISHLNLPEVPEKITTFIGAKGQEAEERESFAKTVQNGDFTTCYVRYGRGDLFDPFGPDKNMHNRHYFDFKKVSESVFNYYIQYLTTTERIFLTRARRSMMEV